MSDINNDKLIAAVYSATLSPDNFDESLDSIDQLIFDQDLSTSDQNDGQPAAAARDNGGGQGYYIDPAIIKHIKLAHDIQLRLGRKNAEKHRILLLLDAAPNPAYIFSQSEKIFAANEPAKQPGGLNQPV